MKQNLFLQGDSGVGKSKILYEVFSPYTAFITGFFVQRLMCDGSKVGFRLTDFKNGYPLSEIAYQPGLSDIFVYQGEFDIDVIEKKLDRIICEAGRCKLIIMDEIGGVEMESSRVTMSYEFLLSGAVPCVGVFKSANNFTRMSRNLELKGFYTIWHHWLEEQIIASGELMTVTEENKDTIQSLMENQYLSKGW